MTCEEQIAELERQCATAMLQGDDHACAAILADDYTLLEVVENQPLQIVLRDEWLKRVRTNGRTAVEVEDVAVSTHGDLAIAVVKLREETTAGTRQLAITDVWRNQQKWQLIERSQSSALPKV